MIQNNNIAQEGSQWGGKQSFQPLVKNPSNEPKIEEVKANEGLPKSSSNLFGKPPKGAGLFKTASPIGGAKSSEITKENNTGSGPSTIFQKGGAQNTSSLFNKTVLNPSEHHKPTSSAFQGKNAPSTEETKGNSSNIFNFDKGSKASPAKTSSFFKNTSQQPQEQKDPSSGPFNNIQKQPEKPQDSWSKKQSSEQPKPNPFNTRKPDDQKLSSFQKGPSEMFNQAKKPQEEGPMVGASSPQAMPSKAKESYQPPQVVMSQPKAAESKTEDSSDYFKKLKLKEYVRLMREMLFLKGPLQFAQVVKTVDQSERKVEKVLQQQLVISEQISQWILKRKDFEQLLFHQEQLLDSVMTRTREIIKELQSLEAFRGMDHIFQKILLLMNTDLEGEDDEEIDPRELMYQNSTGSEQNQINQLSSVISEDQFNALLRDLIVGNSEEKCLSSIKLLMMYEQTERIRQELNTVSTSLGSGLHLKLRDWGKAKAQGQMDEQIGCLQLFNKFYSQLDSLNSSIERNQEKLREAMRIKQKLDSEGQRISSFFT